MDTDTSASSYTRLKHGLFKQGHRHLELTEVKMTKKRKAEIDLSWDYCIRQQPKEKNRSMKE